MAPTPSHFIEKFNAMIIDFERSADNIFADVEKLF